MKKLVFILLVFISVAAAAQDAYQVGNNSNLRLPESETSFTVNVLPDSNAGFILVLDNPQKKKVQLWVRHSVFGTVSDTTVYKEKITFHYSLDNLDDGKYIITVSSGKEKWVRELEMKTVTTVNRNVVVL
jgi:hypothetical protein